MMKLQSLNIRYEDRSIIQDFSLEVQPGEVISIIGPNGSGKSTILKGVSRLIPYDMGQVFIGEDDLKSLSVRQLSRKLSMLSQANASPADMTVEELVSFGRMPHKKWYKPLDEQDALIMEWALQLTGMDRYRDRLVYSLSGGEAQKAWLAMALAQRPAILLLDEPTTYLDIAHQLDVLELVKSLNRELQLTVIMVLHDLNHASTYSDKVCVIHQGTIKAYGPPKHVLTTELIREVYGVEAEIEFKEENHPRIHVLHKI
ncbi:ABC transporter ATP-binding protein [Paenibacillus sp. JCM 10914]|uniref:ABC transporter ATP-binding protein n=1 Tax=Paenibacillus sp. JCM 10914 TaxID=1236974 RepID=UPI0003CC9517|nr:ABC transporter ATP-binding protein [Paenibacillus sp. JCM 10914]GAE08603.1 ferric enterobactin transport ATP-binding protein fepC [Paenibacillus sp. JCM 10914]